LGTGELDTFALDVLLDYLLRTCQISEESPGVYFIVPGVVQLTGPAAEPITLRPLSPAERSQRFGKAETPLSGEPEFFYISPENRAEQAERRLTDRLYSCGSEMEREKTCRECSRSIEKVKQVQNCGSRYCLKCSATRYERALSRLNDSGIYSKRLLHLIVGFPHVKIAGLKEAVKRHGYVMSEYFKELHEVFGIEIEGIHVPDISRRNCLPGELYLHYHFYLLPCGFLPERVITPHRQGFKKRFKTSFTFKVIGYRSRKSMFHYAAKRIAGLYGHGKRYITATNHEGKPYRVEFAFQLPDVMTFDEYCGSFNKIRGFSLHLKKSRRSRSSSNTVPVSDRNLLSCPYCQSQRIKTSWKIVFKQGNIPPPAMTPSKPLEKWIKTPSPCES